MGNSIEKLGVRKPVKPLNIADQEGGILSPIIHNNKSKIVKSLDEIRVETERRFHEIKPQRGTPARLFFDNAFKAMDLLEGAMTNENGLYIADICSPDDAKSCTLGDGMFNPEKPERIYIRANLLLPEQGFDESKEIEQWIAFLQADKLEYEKSSDPYYQEKAKKINPVDDAKSIVKKEKMEYIKHIREIVYRLLHETTHLVWAMESGCSLKEQELNINSFATELMAYGVMAVSGYVCSKDLSWDIPEAFGLDHKFYQSILHGQDVKTVGRAFVDQFFSRIDFYGNRTIISGLGVYGYMTPELADQLPDGLYCTN